MLYSGIFALFADVNEGVVIIYGRGWGGANLKIF